MEFTIHRITATVGNLGRSFRVQLALIVKREPLVIPAQVSQQAGASPMIFYKTILFPFPDPFRKLSTHWTKIREENSSDLNTQKKTYLKIGLKSLKKAL
jgi:hypothetical protein